MIRQDLQTYRSLFSQYTELRAQENRVMNIAYLNGNLVQNVKGATGGVSARTYVGGSWGFASAPGYDRVGEVIREAAHSAAFLDQREKKGQAPFAPSQPVAERSLATAKPRLSQSETMQFMKALDAYITEKYPGLSSRGVMLSCLDMEKQLLTADGASLYSLLARSVLRVSMLKDTASGPVEVFESAGGLGQFEDVFGEPQTLFPAIDALYEHLEKKSEGVYADAGLRECVLDSALAGILAHEAIGHTAEADLVFAGSVAGDYLGQLCASPLITLVDFAHTFRGQTCPMPIYIDDEGTLAEDQILIDEGVLKGYMHNKHSARRFGVSPTGNARAYEYFDEPLIRMRNTIIVPGSSKIADMIASIEDGYYLMKPSNGQADTTSEFMFGVVLGYEIKQGKLGRAIRDLTISGVAFDVLKSVTMVSDDMRWSNGGMCGKKQLIPVGMGGAAVKCLINIGGR